MHHTLVNNKLGSISFDIEKFPSCCGISIIKRVSFYNIKDKKKLYFWFYNTVLWGSRNIMGYKDDFSSPINRSHPYWKINKIIMADKIMGHEYKEGSIYEFCMSQNGIIKGVVNDNPNSSYQTLSFELNRPKNKYNKFNGEYLDPMMGTE